MSIKSFLVLALISFSFGVSAQENKEVKKEVRMEEENGERTLYITTTSGDEVNEEVYRGEAAERKLQELDANEVNEGKVKKEIEVIIENGQKKVVIRTTEGNIITEEEYIGDEADKKLKELESAEHKQGEAHEIQIIEKEIKE